MDYVHIKGFKSIRDAKVELQPINIFIGANGAGKSNFLSFFEFLGRVYNQSLTEYVALNGGVSKILHNGFVESEEISMHISFAKKKNEYSFKLKKSDLGFIFTNEVLWYEDEGLDIANFKPESQIKSKTWSDSFFRGKYIKADLNGLKKYHFHDTGKKSPFTNMSHVVNDSFYLYERGENLAAFLFKTQTEHPKIYIRIIKTIQSIAPYFSDFFFQPNSEGYLGLLWQDKFSSAIYGAGDLSDGTMRFIALTTLFLQPNLPKSIIIDEPELGLHPLAVGKLAGMIQSVAAQDTQVILATQSADLINHFEAQDIITVNQVNGESSFNRLEPEKLKLWLDEYSVGDLWQRSVIPGGQP